MVNKNKVLLSVLSNNLNNFLSEVKKKKGKQMATAEWTVKDELSHLVFWHENYAANYKALAENKEPPLLEGPGYKLNKDGVSSLRNYSVEALASRLITAQDILRDSIIKKNIPQMTYKQDGRIYKTPDFLDMVARHVATHTKQVKKAK